jgi:hypothetical protein
MPDEEAGSRRAVTQVADLTRDCLLRHAELHEHLIGAAYARIHVSSTAPLFSNPRIFITLNTVTPRLPTI